MSEIRQLIGGIGGKFLLLIRDSGEVIAFIGTTVTALMQALWHPRRVRWREALYYMDVCGSNAVPIVFVICYLMGLIIGFQSAVQMRSFGADIFVADLVALSIVKELGPLMVAMIATGRAGSSYAAEIGTMKVAEEIDAMITMGLCPNRFLVVPKLLAMIIVMPLLTVLGSVAGILGGMTVGTMYLGLPVVTFFNRTVDSLTYTHLAEGLSKSVVFAMFIGAAGCLRGFQATRDAQGVGRSTTSAVVTGIFLIIVSDCIMTMLFSMSQT